MTQSPEDYAKALYDLGGATASVNTLPLARRLQVAAASATEMLDRLDALGLVRHDRYRGAVLTAGGKAVAVAMVRHHRLLETYLVEKKLGYALDEVHEEAERLEHVISVRMAQRISEALGQPAVDCEGDPIPDPAGVAAEDNCRSLTQTRAGEQVTVRRVSDRDPGQLRAADHLSRRLGAKLEVLADGDEDSHLDSRMETPRADPDRPRARRLRGVT